LQERGKYSFGRIGGCGVGGHEGILIFCYSQGGGDGGSLSAWKLFDAWAKELLRLRSEGQKVTLMPGREEKVNFGYLKGWSVGWEDAEGRRMESGEAFPEVSHFSSMSIKATGRGPDDLGGGGGAGGDREYPSVGESRFE